MMGEHLREQHRAKQRSAAANQSASLDGTATFMPPRFEAQAFVDPKAPQQTEEERQAKNAQEPFDFSSYYKQQQENPSYTPYELPQVKREEREKVTPFDSSKYFREQATGENQAEKEQEPETQQEEQQQETIEKSSGEDSTPNDGDGTQDATGAAGEIPPSLPNSSNTGNRNTAAGQGATLAEGGNETASAPEKGEAAEFTTKVDSSSSDAYIKSLAQNPPSGFIKGMSETGNTVPDILQKEKDELKESQPEIEQPTGLQTKEAKTKAETEAKAETINVGEPTAVEETTQPKLQEEHPVPSGQLAQVPTPQPQATEEGVEDAALKQNIKDALGNLPTSDPSLTTSAGDRPKVNLTGKANPSQNDSNQTSYKANVTDRAALADQETKKDFGENDVYPEVEVEMLQTEMEMQAPPALTIEPITIPEVPADILANFDADAKAYLDEQTATELTKHDEAATKRDEDSEKTKEEKMTELDTETERIKSEQETAQSDAKTEVDLQRENWRTENEALREEFKTKSKTERDRIDGEINSKIAETDKEVNQELSKAEKEAAEKQRAANKEAAAKKAEAENEESGFWGWVGKKLSQAFDALKKTVNYIFDQLRAAVKQLIEAAKKMVTGLIELARKAIVGLIKAFGEFLKALVSTLLAAFPEIAKKINAYIDAAVDKAVETVNKLAETLKEIANAILDFLGKALDTILSVFQAIYSAVLTGLSMIANGEIKKILEGLANLGRAIAAFPGEFMGALSEEALGTDLSNPIPNIERTDAENEEFAAQFGDFQETMLQEEFVPPTPSMENNALAEKAVLSNDDVMLQPSLPVEIDPAILASLNLADGETMELGGSANPVTTADLRAEAFGDAPALDVPMETTAPALESASSAPQAPSTEGPDWLSMSDDQKLDHYIAEMGKDEGEPDSKDTSKAEPVADTPIIAKTGKLSVGQRMSFAGRQMIAGMKSWFFKNQAAIYATVAGILVVGGVVAFFTGGAGLMALVPVLMKVLMAYFIADALTRAKGHFADFFTKGWAGDAQGGGKALAKGLSVIISEFVFEYVLRGVGKALKRVRDGIKASKTFQRVSKTASRANKTMQATPGIGHAMRGVSKAKNATVNSGKYVINKIRKGTGKGAKKLSDLRRKVLDAFGFKRLWLEKEGKYVELWGKFNSEVLLSRTDGTIESRPLNKADRETLAGLKDGFERTGDNVGKRQIEVGRKLSNTEIIVSDAYANILRKKAAKIAVLKDKISKLGDSDKVLRGDLEAKIRKLDDEILEDFSKLQNMDAKGIRKMVGGSSPPAWLDNPKIPIEAKEAFYKRGSLRGKMKPSAGQNPHHINPIESLGDSKVLQDATKHGFKYNDKVNGINLEQYSSKTARNGTHANHPKYNQGISDLHEKFNKRFIQKHNYKPKTDSVLYADIFTAKMEKSLSKLCGPNAKPKIKVNELFDRPDLFDVDKFYMEVMADFRKSR